MLDVPRDFLAERARAYPGERLRDFVPVGRVLLRALAEDFPERVVDDGADDVVDALPCDSAEEVELVLDVEVHEPPVVGALYGFKP